MCFHFHFLYNTLLIKNVLFLLYGREFDLIKHVKIHRLTFGFPRLIVPVIIYYYLIVTGLLSMYHTKYQTCWNWFFLDKLDQTSCGNIFWWCVVYVKSKNSVSIEPMCVFPDDVIPSWDLYNIWGLCKSIFPMNTIVILFSSDLDFIEEKNK